MKKVVFVILLMVMLSACAYNYMFKTITETYKPETPVTEEPKIPSLEQTEGELMKQCINENMDFGCIAFARRDSSLCEKVADEGERRGCVNEIESARGYVQKNAEFCNTVADKEMCQAFVLGEVGLCGGDVGCEAIAARDKLRCGKVSGIKREECESGFDYAEAIAFGKEELCHGDLTCEAYVTKDEEKCNASTKDYCQQRVGIKMGFATGVFECDKVDIDMKTECLQEQDHYFLLQGLNTEDVQWCEKISGVESRKACISIVNQDAEACAIVKDENDRFLCTVSMFEKKKNVALCDSLSKRKQECIDYYNKFVAAGE